MTYAGMIDANAYIKRNFAPLEDRSGRLFPWKTRLRNNSKCQSKPDGFPAKLYGNAIQVARGLCFIFRR